LWIVAPGARVCIERSSLGPVFIGGRWVRVDDKTFRRTPMQPLEIDAVWKGVITTGKAVSLVTSATTAPDPPANSAAKKTDDKATKPEPPLPPPCEEPTAVRIADSIVDVFAQIKTDVKAFALRGLTAAGGDVQILRTTIRGMTQARSITAEDTAFLGAIEVAEKNDGWLRYCYLDKFNPDDKTQDEATPVRYRCQPETARNAPAGACSAGVAVPAVAAAGAALPLVTEEFGQPGYMQLLAEAPPEWSRSASDGGEIGAFNDAFFAQRHASLRARLTEFTPTNAVSAVVYADDLTPLGGRPPCSDHSNAASKGTHP
jgi:hypothetical protein